MSFNHLMTVMGYIWTALLIIHYMIVGVRWFRLKQRKRRFERKHGKGSYGAVMFLAGIKRMVDEAEKEEQ